MRNRIITLCLREIKKSYKRFLSLLIMSFLGVAVFVGMRSASNVMLASLDKYYDENNVYDIKIISTLGLTESDIKELKTLDLVSEVYGIHSKDVYFETNEKTYVIKLYAINNNINKIIVKDGRLPKNNNEVVVESYLLVNNNLKIGDNITIKDPDNNIKNKELKIVGVVDSPLYLLVGGPALMRGTSNLGSGQINFYAYVLDDLFDMDYYSEIYLTIKDAKELTTSKKDYEKLINYGLGEINAIKKYREKARYDEIYNCIMNEILEQEKEGQKQLENANNQLNSYKKELDNGFNKLKTNKNKLENSKIQLNNSLIELNNAKMQINNGYLELEKAKKEIQNGKEKLQEELSKYNLTIEDILTLIDIFNEKEVSKESLKNLIKDESQYKEDIDKVIDYFYDNNYFKQLNEYFTSGLESKKQELIDLIPKDIDNYDKVIDFINNINLDEIKNKVLKTIIDTDKVEDLKKYIPTDIRNYDNIIEFLDNYIDKIEKIKQLFNSVITLQNAEIEINKNEQELNKSNSDYNEAYKMYLNYKKQITTGEIELNRGYNTYYENLRNYNKGVEEFNNKKIDFEKKIAKAKEDINTLEIPTWYINTRNDNSDYSSYIGVGGSINKLAEAFPTIFFIVAIFMSIMSMSRMALEDRTEIGSLKALGFSNINIMTKYIFYSSLATIIGGILGSLFGFYFLTYFIWKMYRILYNVTAFKYVYDFLIIIIGILLAVLCITGTTILTVKNIIKENSAALLRPKAPPSGKNMFIERTYLWKKINFSNKVTIRNVFRYRKRVFMTVIGIMGCTILLLTGYGIRDSIVNIPTKQFDEVMVYDDLIYYSSNYKYNEEILNNPHIKNKVNILLKQAYVENSNVNLTVVDDYKTSNKIVKLKSIDNNKEIMLKDNVVAISSKLSELYNIKKGDSIKIKDYDNKEYNITITDIYTNYIGHHIFMNKDTYQKIFDDYKINASYIKLDNIEYEESITSNLMKNDNVSMVVSTSYSKLTVSNMLKSLDSVVYILIIFSGLLSFVVLYNLSYINISERRREIASLKVLGFYDIEVDNYIIKENFIITLIGIILGILIGKLFVDFIVNSIEIDLVKFIHVIATSSYMKTFIFMLSFTIIVSFIIHFTLKKINMIDSLKSVE